MEGWMNEIGWMDNGWMEMELMNGQQQHSLHRICRICLD